MIKKSLLLAIEKARLVNTKPLKNKKLTSELSYVLGVINGDGHVSQRRIILSAIDKDFVKNFKYNLDKWSKYKSRFYSRLIKTDNKIKNRKLQWVCYLDSIKIENFIKNFNYNNLKDVNHKIQFIKGFFDSEGSFSKDYELIAYNKDYSKLKLISNYLFDLGLNNQIKTYTVKNINNKLIKYHHLKVLGKSRYLFYQKIGFSVQRKHKRLETWAQTIGLKYKGGMNYDRRTRS